MKQYNNKNKTCVGWRAPSEPLVILITVINEL